MFCVLSPFFSFLWTTWIVAIGLLWFLHIFLFWCFLLHLSLNCKLNFALCATKSSVCMRLNDHWRKVCLSLHCSCISFTPLHIYGTMRFSSPHSACAASSALVCYPFPLPCPSKTKLSFVVVPCNGLTVSVCWFCSLFYGKENILWVIPRRTEFMQRKVLVLVVAIWTWFWPKVSSVLKSCEHASAAAVDATWQQLFFSLPCNS